MVVAGNVGQTDPWFVFPETAKVGVAGGFTVKVCVLDAEAAPVVVTPTLADPTEAMSDARMAAVSSVALTKVVVLGEPFHVTEDDPDTKLVPFTVIVKPGDPTVAEDGVIEVVVGTGTTTP